MNILIPIVGRGTRVKNYNIPKPLIPVNGKPIIQRCIESFKIPANYIFIVRKFSEYPEADYTTELKNLLKSLKSTASIIEIDYVTEGPACSALLAKNLIDNSEELIVTNCDQQTDWNPSGFLNYVRDSNCDGCVITYPHGDIVVGQPSPYSFIQLNEDGVATLLEEKFAISEHALNGIHYWKKGSDFVKTAEEMIRNNDRINNEFYISKTYNYLIKDNKKVVSYKMNPKEFWALGSQQEIEKFLNANL